MKVSELSGADLDCCVARAENLREAQVSDTGNGEGPCCYYKSKEHGAFPWQQFSPSRDWSQGGPIIERERINVVAKSNPDMGGNNWIASVVRPLHHGYGATPLIAAMRAYVASKFGPEVGEAAAAKQEAA